MLYRTTGELGAQVHPLVAARGVAFVSVENMMRLVNAVGVEPLIVAIAEAIEADFRRWEEFDKTARVASHSAVGVIELMPVADREAYAFKYVNGHPGNTRRGLQTVTAFGVLSSVASGYPVLLSEMTILTALRTAAASVVAARVLAPAGARTMALIGNGAQAAFQALAFRAVLGVDRVRLYDIDRGASARCAEHLAAAGLAVTVCGSAAEAVAGAEILTTATADKANATILSDNLVGAGVHINAIGGDCPGKTEVAPGVLRRASVFVEYEPQTRVEGDIQQLRPDEPVTELWRVLAGAAPGRRRADEITVFDSVGFAVEDFSALRTVWRLLAEHPHFEPLDLVADPDEPQDLYGMVMRAKARG